MWSAKVGRFPADGRRRLTSTQPSHSSRPGSPLSLARLTDGMWRVSATLGFRCVREPCGAAAVRGVSGQREQPSRPAGGELPHRDSSSRLRRLRCDAHFWLAGGCHIAEFSSLSVLWLSRYILFKVRRGEAYERSSQTAPLLSQRRDHVEAAPTP